MRAQSTKPQKIPQFLSKKTQSLIKTLYAIQYRPEAKWTSLTLSLTHMPSRANCQKKAAINHMSRELVPWLKTWSRSRRARAQSTPTLMDAHIGHITMTDAACAAWQARWLTDNAPRYESGNNVCHKPKLELVRFRDLCHPSGSPK